MKLNRSSRNGSGVIPYLCLPFSAWMALGPAPAASQVSTATQEVQTEASLSQASTGDIIVTATRRSQSAQQVPISLTAIGAEQLAEQGVTNVGQLSQLAPSLYVLTTSSEGGPRYSLRGVTGFDTFASATSPVATYIDDVYQAAQFGVLNSVFDIQRVEVLRGPQGTTFGKNATGGAVAYFSQVPTNEAEGYVSARVAGGDRPERFIESAMNVPLVNDILAMRISLRADSRSDFIEDVAANRERGASNSQTGRVLLRYTPGSDTAVNFIVSGTRFRGAGPLGRAQFLPGAVNSNQIQMSAHDLYDEFDNYGATLRVEQRLGSVNLTSISHYRKTTNNTAQDIDATADDLLFYRATARATQYGQELRIASDVTKPLSWIVGLYFQKDRIDEQQVYAATRNGPAFDYNNFARPETRTSTYAIFTSLTYRIDDSISIIGGIRKSIEKRRYENRADYFLSGGYDWTDGNLIYSGPPPIAPDQPLQYPQRQQAKPWTWDVTLNYTPSRDILVFARAARGFRSGGFNPPPFAFSTAQLPLSAPPTYNAEFIQSYEVGTKATLLDGKLRLNAGVFRYDYTDQQVPQFISGVQATRNAGRSRINGGEIEVNVLPIEALMLRASIGYTDAKFKRYIQSAGVDYSGNRLLQAPEWTSNWGVSYRAQVNTTYEFVANTAWSYRSSLFFDASNDPVMRGPSLLKGDIRLGLESSSGKGLSVTAFVQNLTNERPLGAGFNFGPGYYVKYFETGRIFGLDARYRW